MTKAGSLFIQKYAEHIILVSMYVYLSDQYNSCLETNCAAVNGLPPLCIIMSYLCICSCLSTIDQPIWHLQHYLIFKYGILMS